MSTRTHRPIPLGLTMLVALFSALVALALSGGHDASAHDDASHASHAISVKELALRQDMRKLWEDHVTWTRLAVISLTTDAPDTQATVGRLLANQVHIGNAIKPYYGKKAGNQLTALLRQHILVAADVIAAAKKADTAAVSSEQTRW
jgi:hypothetical protein